MIGAFGWMCPILNWAGASNTQAPPGFTTAHPGEYPVGPPWLVNTTRRFTAVSWQDRVGLPGGSGDCIVGSPLFQAVLTGKCPLEGQLTLSCFCETAGLAGIGSKLPRESYIKMPICCGQIEEPIVLLLTLNS